MWHTSRTHSETVHSRRGAVGPDGDICGLAQTVKVVSLLLVVLPVLAAAQGQHHEHHQMQMDGTGMVMNANSNRLPRGCEEISRDYEFSISAGREFAEDSPGMIFGMSQHEIRVEPCSRLTVSFTNNDEVRHQWMVHGLPKYLSPVSID